jgi:hypothetical protein
VQAQKTHLLAIDLDQPMDNELPRLPHTTRKEGPEDGRVQSPLQRIVCHLHVRRHGGRPLLLLLVCALSSPCSLLGAIISRQVFVVHGHDGGQVPLELALPLLLLQMLAVVGSCARLGRPFLLEVCPRRDVGCPQLRDGVERPA